MRATASFATTRREDARDASRPCVFCRRIALPRAALTTLLQGEPAARQQTTSSTRFCAPPSLSYRVFGRIARNPAGSPRRWALRLPFHLPTYIVADSYPSGGNAPEQVRIKLHLGVFARLQIVGRRRTANRAGLRFAATSNSTLSQNGYGSAFLVATKNAVPLVPSC